MLYLLVFFLSLIITIFSTPFLINFLTQLNIVDVPGGRRINTSAIPRMGGILIYIIIAFSIINYTYDLTTLRYVLLGSGFLVICGVLDDLKSLNWHFKFMLQSVTAALIIMYIYPMIKRVEIFGTFLSYPIDIIVLFFLITGAINALNMLDGMDGLVSGFSLLQFILVFILAYTIGNSFLLVLSAAAIGSLIGFLKFNASPAKIFLGDTGSLVLGFFLILSALLLTHGLNPRSLDLGFPIILLGVPIVDTLRVMTVRIWKGQNIFLADNNHIHHMIAGNLIRHKTTVFIIQLFTVFFIILSLVYVFYNSFLAYVLFCVSSVVFFMLNNIMLRFRKADVIKKFIYQLMPENIITIDLYKKYLLPFSAVTVIGMIFLLFPSDSNLPADVILLMLMICILLFTASFISFRRNHSFNDLYVFINLVLFFSIADLSRPMFHLEYLFGKGNWILLSISAFSILFISVLFFLSRRKMFSEKISLLTGVDLILIIILGFLLLLENMIEINGLWFVEGNFVIGLTIYIWYKLIMFFTPRLNKVIYYFSFALPLVTLIILWI